MVTLPGIEDPTLATALLLVAIMAFAGLVHGTLGLGFPMMATPLLAMQTDVRSAILITLLPTITVNIASIVKGGRWGRSIGRYWPLAVYVSAGSAAGTWLLIHTDPAPYKLWLAAIIVLYLNLDRISGLDMTWVLRNPAIAMGAFGVAAGLSAGTVNVMVPILIVLFLELDEPPTATVQVFNMCFLSGKLVQVALFLSAGSLTPASAAGTLPLAAVALAALAGGMVLRERVDARTYRRWLRVILKVAVVVLVVQAVWSFRVQAGSWSG